MNSKNPIRNVFYILLAVFSLLGQFSIADENYDYPIKNPLAATVIGTPAEY
jgi:hypothetical protein